MGNSSYSNPSNTSTALISNGTQKTVRAGKVEVSGSTAQFSTSGDAACGITITNLWISRSEICNEECVTLKVNTNTTDSIRFVYFASPTDNPYVDGTFIGKAKPNAEGVAEFPLNAPGISLPDNNDTVSLTCYVYAILDEKPSDPTCRPFDGEAVVVLASPKATISASPICGNDTQVPIHLKIHSKGSFRVHFAASTTNSTCQQPEPAGTVKTFGGIAGGGRDTTLYVPADFTGIIMIINTGTGCRTIYNAPQFTRAPRPSAGTDIVDVCTSTGTTKLTGSSGNGTWSVVGTPPGVAVDNDGNVTGLINVGTYQFAYNVNGCADTVSVKTKDCEAPCDITISDIEVAPGEVCNGGCVTVKVNTTTSDSVRFVYFENPVDNPYEGGAYLGTAKPDANGAVQLSGVSLTFNNRLTAMTCYIYAILNNPPDANCKPKACAPIVLLPSPKATITAEPVCEGTAEVPVRINLESAGSFRIHFAKGATDGKCQQAQPVEAVKTFGGIAGGGKDTVLYVPANFSGIVMIINTGTGCRTIYDAPQFVTKPKPNAGADLTNICSSAGTTQLTGSPGAGTWSVVGSPAGVAVDASGKVTGLTGLGTYQFAYTVNGCADTVAVTVIDCEKVYDLALSKSVNKRIVMQGEDITFTIKVWNEGEYTATGIEVTDLLNAGLQYVSHTTASGDYTAATGKWTFASLSVGDTATLKVVARVVGEGVFFNTAEITKMDQEDVDSTPGNGVESEDDIDRQCITVPIKLCAGQAVSVELSIPAQYTGVVWFRKKQGGTPEQVGTGNTYVATETELGSYEYTYTASQGTCPAEGCCPVIVVVEECCPANICVPFTVRRVRK
ncbi:DUF11 domain-containing protein [Telluribacter sp. SYSU D00476]|uniref:DUF11 domain-containing protein n=1 Tax=Telluribacter sp. SYSU D00476 TaxID=2811430 RepID=UPI001FF616A2|nr:DUF11 domain-containing protein [Telluribacter sp. SYSU D00476]